MSPANETQSAAHHHQLEINRLGLWLFFLSESMIFLILLMTRFFLLGASRPADMDQFLGLVVTVVLLLSSLTAYRSELAIAHDDRPAFLRNLLCTIVLGTVFLLVVVLIEWREAGHMGIVPQSDFGIAFFSMTGMHAFHVLTGAQERLPVLITRYAYALVPVSFGVWVAHFAFHFLTGFLTIIPVLQSTLADLGWTGLGKPRWDLGGLPSAWLFPIELGIMGLGWWGSLLVAYRLAEQGHPEAPRRAFVPWALLLSLILLAAVWLMAQPMEMRGTFLQG